MAKYCAKCGRALPDGVEICPDCHVAAREGGAAPFTRMTAETEVWKTPEEAAKKKRPKRIRTKTQKQNLAYLIAAVAVVVIAVCLILFVQPQNRVVRALRAGDYERAAYLYWNEKSLVSGAHDEQIGKAVLQAAEQVRDDFANHKLSADDAAAALSRLGTFGERGEELIADVIADYRALSESRDHMARAEKLSANGDHLAARDEYLLVIESDSDYADAREKAEASLDRYAERVLSRADVYIQSGDYASAIEALSEGERALLAYDVYNEKLSFKCGATFVLFEENLLAEAENLAALEDYVSAAELLRQNMERFDYETEALTGAMEGYLDLAQDQILAEAQARADRLYAEGSYAEAFALIEDLKAQSGARTEAIAAAVNAMEERFAADKLAEAEAIFAGAREKLPEAIAVLNDALKVRELEALQAYLDDISRYLPGSLAEMEYTEMSGTVFRSAGVFEGLDGTEYGGGWVWGANNAELTFLLEGGYDLLEATFAVRRDDNTNANGRFEVLCDGERVYQSETLRHRGGEPVAVSVDISGCETLTLRFINDYNVQTSEGGYCYHGLCAPTITKNLPGTERAETAESAETE